jgi:competence CoiA-like predicted nuclease
MNEHDDHSYALDLQDKLKHISEVERGRKGYFCPGCRQRMIARKGDIKIHHFAHDPQDVERRGKCSYSDETIRHKLGKEILQHLKHVKVPSLRKYPADGQSGGVQIIRESWTVEAD